MTHVFLINPLIKDKAFSDKLRQHLASRGDIDFFVFNINYYDDGNSLVKHTLKYLDNDTLRFYVVGGMGTFHRILNAFDEHFEDIELAWIPMGTTNSFAKNFENDDFFLDVDRQIKGTAVPMDYLKTNHGIAINAISFGFDARYLKLLEKSTISQFGSTSLFINLLMIHAALTAFPFKCQITADKSVVHTMSFAESFFFGSGSFLQKQYQVTTGGKLDDGIGEYAIGKKTSKLKIIELVLTAFQTVITSNFNLKYGSAKKIRLVGETPIPAVLDGVLYPDHAIWEAAIVHDKLHFVLPLGVEI